MKRREFPTFPQPLRRVLCTAEVEEGCGNGRRWTAWGQQKKPAAPNLPTAFGKLAHLTLG